MIANIAAIGTKPLYELIRTDCTVQRLVTIFGIQRFNKTARAKMSRNRNIDCLIMNFATFLNHNRKAVTYRSFIYLIF